MAKGSLLSALYTDEEIKRIQSPSWAAAKYGRLVDDYETKQGGCFIRQKIYRLDGKHYLETWVNGYRVAFIELEVYR